MKFYPYTNEGVLVWSPPSRGAWIEILVMLLIYVTSSVAPLAGGVD